MTRELPPEKLFVPSSDLVVGDVRKVTFNQPIVIYELAPKLRGDCKVFATTARAGVRIPVVDPHDIEDFSAALRREHRGDMLLKPIRLSHGDPHDADDFNAAVRDLHADLLHGHDDLREELHTLKVMLRAVSFSLILLMCIAMLFALTVRI